MPSNLVMRIITFIDRYLFRSEIVASNTMDPIIKLSTDYDLGIQYSTFNFDGIRAPFQSFITTKPLVANCIATKEIYDFNTYH